MFREDNGNFSMARFLSFISVLSGVVIGFTAVLTRTLTVEAVSLSLGMVSLGIAGKVVSKKIEA